MPKSNSEQSAVSKSVRKTASITTDKKKRRKKRQEPNFRSSIQKLMKVAFPDYSISKKSMNILDAVTGIIVKKFSEEAGAISRSNKRSTVSAKDVEAATWSLLPEEMGLHANSHSMLALLKYKDSFPPKDPKEK